MGVDHGRAARAGRRRGVIRVCLHGAESTGKSTLAEYTIAVDSGKFVPQFIEDYLTRKDLPQILNSLRRRVESDGKWKKD